MKVPDHRTKQSNRNPGGGEVSMTGPPDKMQVIFSVGFCLHAVITTQNPTLLYSVSGINLLHKLRENDSIG